MPESEPIEAITPHKLAALPNILTVSRIISIPFLVWGILRLDHVDSGIIGNPGVVIGLFILAGITDFLDGFLARRWGLVSDFGRMIDPIADKLLVAGCLIAIAIATSGVWYILVPALAIIGRDILVSGAREHAALKSRAMPPTQLAKWKTACEMLALFSLILAQAAKTEAAASLSRLYETGLYGGLGLLWMAALLSAYTGSLYFRAALRD